VRYRSIIATPIPACSTDAALRHYVSLPAFVSIVVACLAFSWRFATRRNVSGFGIDRGSLTWIDRYDCAWRAGFANYDVVPDDQTEPYGGGDNTQVVKLDDDFRVVAAWTIPAVIVDRFKPMSNSGGSSGPRRPALADQSRPRSGVCDDTSGSGLGAGWVAAATPTAERAGGSDGR
jgi:hypothetical protein